MRPLTLPQEVEVWYIFPYLRGEIAKSLIKKGLSQKKVSQLLGITQAAVSQYIKKKRASNKLTPTKGLKNKIKSSVQKLLKDQTRQQYIKQIQILNNFTKTKKILCQLHKKYDSSLPQNCDICGFTKNS